jgi:hypothetical protein
VKFILDNTFSIDKCTKCGAERYLYNLSGQLIVGKDGRIFIKDDVCREINLADWLRSWVFIGGKVRISVERI